MSTVGERQGITQKGVRAIDARNSWLENGSNAAKTSVRAPGFGGGSDLFSDLVQTVWQKLRESGFQLRWAKTRVLKMDTRVSKRAF